MSLIDVCEYCGEARDDVDPQSAACVPCARTLEEKHDPDAGRPTCDRCGETRGFISAHGICEVCERREDEDYEA
jgi:ribosomal protein S14